YAAGLPAALEVSVEVALHAVRPQAGDLGRAAEVGAEVVLLERGLVGGAPLPGVQAIALVIVEHGAVEPLASRLRGGDDLAGGARPVLRLVARGHDLDLADHVRGEGEVLEDGDHAALAHEALLHARAVHHGLVAGLHAAVDPGVERVGPASAGDAGHQQDEAGRRARPGPELAGQLLQ